MYNLVVRKLQKISQRVIQMELSRGTKQVMVILALGVMFSFFGMVQSSQAAAADNPVQLHKAEINYFTERGVIYGYNVQGYVTVDNSQTIGDVSVTYTYDYNNWDLSQAKFVGRTEGKELWYFETARKDVQPYKYFNYDCQFAVKCENNGQVYWDNNGGQDYLLQHKVVGSERVNKPHLLAETNVAVDNINQYYADREQTDIYLRGDMILKNLAYDKEVKVIYTTDNWETRQEVAASYGSSYDNDLEDWNFKIEDVAAGTTVKYLAAYKVDGTTYWDTGFNQAYEFKVE